jgi:manganese/zinc/iron transport system substrate-binding protein
MITDMVENVGGERVQVTGLMGPGVLTRTCTRPPPETSQHLMNADIIFYNGLHLEAQLGEVLEANASQDQ